MRTYLFTLVLGVVLAAVTGPSGARAEDRKPSAAATASIESALAWFAEDAPAARFETVLVKVSKIGGADLKSTATLGFHDRGRRFDLDPFQGAQRCGRAAYERDPVLLRKVPLETEATKALATAIASAKGAPAAARRASADYSIVIVDASEPSRAVELLVGEGDELLGLARRAAKSH